MAGQAGAGWAVRTILPDNFGCHARSFGAFCVKSWNHWQRIDGDYAVDTGDCPQARAKAMTAGARRVVGWKGIAAYFRRDRTTVMRWAQTRGLPVHRVPGAGSASVYALTDELDDWLARYREHDEAPPAPAPSPVPEPPAVRARPGRLVLGAVAGGALALLAGAAIWHRAPPPRPLPHDPAVAELYLQARDNWAARTSPRLQQAIAEFSAVVRRDPDFAPAHAGLAESYLLVREFAAVPDAIAYPRAEAAARRALELDPKSQSAHRALGFISYWWRRDIPAARQAFATALQLDPDDAQTHFWFGNALVDNGEAEAGFRELEAARLRTPGSPAIEADSGWALWSSGKGAAAKRQLLALTQDGHASAPFAYLAYIALAERDWPLYLDYGQRRAELRQDSVLITRNAAERAAFRQGGAAALLDLMARNTVSDPAAVASDSSWPAALAALAGNRARLLQLLQQAEQRREVWGLSGLTGPAFAPWQSDPEIGPLLRNRKGQSLQIGTALRQGR